MVRPRHVSRSCDLSSLTSSAVHSRASGILPASRKARAFARAWLTADRSAADSFPERGTRAARPVDDMLRIVWGPRRFQRATNRDRQRLQSQHLLCQPTAVPLSSISTIRVAIVWVIENTAWGHSRPTLCPHGGQIRTGSPMTLCVVAAAQGQADRPAARNAHTD